MKNGICPKCESTDIIPDVTIVDYSRNQFAGNLQLTFERNPNAIVFKDRIHASVTAWVCGGCGYMELFTSNHHELLYAHQELMAHTEVGQLVPNAPKTRCAKCGQPVPDDAEACAECGTERQK